MTRFAAKTEVPADKTRHEIEKVVMRYGATAFQSGWEGDRAMVQFRFQERYVRLVMSLPNRGDEAFTTYMQGPSLFRRTETAAAKLWDQAVRQRWRAMLLLIKAKLEAIESGIVTFEEEFFSHVVMSDGGTVYEHAASGALAIAYTGDRPPPLLIDRRSHNDGR